MNAFWRYEFLNNTFKDWAIALSVIVGSLILLRIIKTVFVKRLKVRSAKTITGFDDFVLAVIESAIMPLLYILTVYSGLQYLNLPAKVDKVVYVAMLFCATFFVLRIITSGIRYFFQTMLMAKDRGEKRDKQAEGILVIINVLVWLLGILFLIDNLGYDITTVVAGLGIGGIAIALAAQTILGDIFSYLVIFFDKPFEVGDFIVVDDKMGSIEHIGIKTTRIRTLSGEQLICSNSDLTNARLHNFKRMEERRVQFQFGVVYNTPANKIQQIPSMIRKIIEQEKDLRFDRAHFKSFGASSLDFEVVYYVLSSDYNKYMDIQQRLNLAMFQQFESEGIQFAFPTQTIFVSGADVKSSEKNVYSGKPMDGNPEA